MNLLGLLPFGVTSTANLSVTGALAIVAFVATEVSGFRALGPAGYARTVFFVPAGVPGWMKPILLVILAPVEFLGKLTKPFSLAVRLFANMMAGHTLVLAILGLILVYQNWFVAGTSVLVASVIMTVFFLFMIRHGVMSTARDQVDLVVVFFGLASVFGSIALATWGNYFYGWVFSSTAILTMLPAVILGYVFTLGLSEQIEWQPITTDLKPQVMLASACAVVAILVLTSVALAASTRLGQVMTIVVCAGMLMLGLLSNHLFGRFAFSNTQVGAIRAVSNPDDVPMDRAGDSVTITLESAPKTDVDPGRAIYYGAEPTGLRMLVPEQPQTRVDIGDSGNIRGPNAIPGLVVAERQGELDLVLLNTGGLDVARPPAEGDYLFAGPTEYNPAAFAAWAVVPNLQAFWLVDAVTQGHDIPASYIGLVVVYGGIQIVMFLSLGVLLFQRREVG